MNTGRFETTIITLAGVVVVNRLAKFVERCIIPPQITQSAQDHTEEADKVDRQGRPYMPDVEMDEWLEQNGMPTRGGWTPTSDPSEQL